MSMSCLIRSLVNNLRRNPRDLVVGEIHLANLVTNTDADASSGCASFGDSRCFLTGGNPTDGKGTNAGNDQDHAKPSRGKHQFSGFGFAHNCRIASQHL